MYKASGGRLIFRSGKCNISPLHAASENVSAIGKTVLMDFGPMNELPSSGLVDVDRIRGTEEQFCPHHAGIYIQRAVWDTHRAGRTGGGWVRGRKGVDGNGNVVEWESCLCPGRTPNSWNCHWVWEVVHTAAMLGATCAGNKFDFHCLVSQLFRILWTHM